jgi:tRNA threonylcarbamoyladenosine biosynthesis protein TsaB
VIILAIDTSENRGSVALVREGRCLAAARHEFGVDYSAWLLPAVDGVLQNAGTKMEQVELLAVTTGPGSFTGLRVGLTTVKAWAEVYGKPVVGVSRLEAIARTVGCPETLVAASYDAQRGQLFGALYRGLNSRMSLIGDERVVSPEEFVAAVDEQAGKEAVTWVGLDLQLIRSTVSGEKRASLGDRFVVCSDELASTIGILGEERASAGELSDPLELDANYVRRSDAEIFWKDTPSRVR